MPPTSDLVATVLVEGDEVEVQLAPAELHLAGPFTGNVVVVVRTAPVLPPKAVVSELRIAVGTDAELLAPMAYEPFDDGSIEITFHSPTALSQAALPNGLKAHWGRNPATLLGPLVIRPASAGPETGLPKADGK